jgi:hypothetical protein
MHSTDEADFRFLTAADAVIRLRIAADERGQAELQVFGNRAGLLSLANVLLWFVADASGREFLGFGELPFVQVEPPLVVFLRLTDADGTGQHGILRRTDRGEQFEWSIPEDDLERVALIIHRLVCIPWHEYDRLMMGAGSDAEVQIRLTDGMSH